MRENRSYGSEGGEALILPDPYVRPSVCFVSIVKVCAAYSHRTCSRRQLRRRGVGCSRRSETGWRAAGGEWTARRMTNPIRRRVAASLLMCGEAWDRKEPTGRTRW